MKIEIWNCIDCGKEIEVNSKRNKWKSQLSERCGCGGYWKFKEQKHDE